MMPERGWGGRWIVSAALGSLVLGCGGAQRELRPSVVASPEEPTDARNVEDGLVAEGLFGTLSDAAIRRGIAGQERQLHACIVAGADRVDVMEGQLVLAFRVAGDGTVRWVHPASSSLGDRDTERCLVAAAARCRFARPRGGEVEFQWPLEVMISEDVRPPSRWRAEDLEPELAAQKRLLRTCATDQGAEPSGLSASVTAYVGPGGEVLAVGAASLAPLPGDVLDCIAERVGSWELPDPGSYPAKVSFRVALSEEPDR